MVVNKHIFKLEAVQKIYIPEYKGSTFHGGFGRALKIISPTYYEYFYGDKPSQVPRPYLITPPLDTKTEYKNGQQFSFSLTLFGEACEYHAICHAAVEYLGNHMGLGAKSGKFKVISHVQEEYSKKKAKKNLKNKNQLKLNFVARLRIKKDKKIIRHEFWGHETYLFELHSLGTIEFWGHI